GDTDARAKQSHGKRYAHNKAFHPCPPTIHRASHPSRGPVPALRPRPALCRPTNYAAVCRPSNKSLDLPSARMPHPPVVGPAEIAALLAVTRQMVDWLARNDTTFPRPIAHLVGGRVWDRKDVERWARKSGRID